MSEPIQIRKMNYVIQVSEELLPNYVDPRPGHIEPPTAEELTAYNAWKAKFESLYKEGSKRGRRGVGSLTADPTTGSSTRPRKTGGSTTTRRT